MGQIKWTFIKTRTQILSFAFRLPRIHHWPTDQDLHGELGITKLRCDMPLAFCYDQWCLKRLVRNDLERWKILSVVGIKKRWYFWQTNWKTEKNHHIHKQTNRFKNKIDLKAKCKTVSFFDNDWKVTTIVLQLIGRYFYLLSWVR